MTRESNRHSMSDPAGRLNIALQRSGSGLNCRIDSTRPVTAARVFTSRTPLEVAGLIPMLFSICARAQSCAGVTALEQALGQPAPPAVDLARRRSVLVERLREHLWRILLDWPPLVGADPERETMQEVVRQAKTLCAALDPDGTLFRPDGTSGRSDRARMDQAVDQLDTLVAERVFGMSAADWLHEIDRRAALGDWAGSARTGAARLLHALALDGTGALGQSPVAPLPELADAELIAAMSGPAADDFVARPTWGGEPYETSPFARQSGAPLLLDLAPSLGNGILPRLAAQLREVALALVELRAEPESTSRTETPLPPGGGGVGGEGGGIGLGRAEAARGRLAHLARVADGRVREYRILAPTEWNCHPHGILARGLAGLPSADERLLERSAQLLVISTDPCVAYTLTISPT